jgi:hypothetical protein
MHDCQVFPSHDRYSISPLGLGGSLATEDHIPAPKSSSFALPSPVSKMEVTWNVSSITRRNRTWKKPGNLRRFAFVPSPSTTTHSRRSGKRAKFQVRCPSRLGEGEVDQHGCRPHREHRRVIRGPAKAHVILSRYATQFAPC